MSYLLIKINNDFFETPAVIIYPKSLFRQAFLKHLGLKLLVSLMSAKGISRIYLLIIISFRFYL